MKLVHSVFRDYIIEAYPCRLCTLEQRTSDENLIASQLCSACYSKRQEFRNIHPMHSKNKPKDYDKRAENFLTGEPFGENRDYISVVCGGCEDIYDLVPEGFCYQSVEFQKKHYNATLAFHKGIKPFKAKTFSTKYAPPGWDNQILCKSCHDTFVDRNEAEIQQFSPEEITQGINLKNETEVAKPKGIGADDSDDNERSNLGSKDKAWLVGGLIFFGVILLGFIRLMIVDGPSAAFENAPGPALLFVIVAVFGWFVLSGYLQDKGAHNTGKTMWNVGKVIVILFFLSVILSKCGGSFDDVEDIRPPRSL
jgi:hypothetical protein